MIECFIELAELPLPEIRSLSVQDFCGILFFIRILAYTAKSSNRRFPVFK
jgi:hypothetical protein